MVEPALDRAMFRTLVNCIGVRVKAQDVTFVQKALGRKSLLAIRNVRNVIKDGEDHRVVLLDPEVNKNEEELRSLLNGIAFEAKEQVVEVSYDQQQADEILRKLLPPDVEVPSGFETIGHIAHLNLRPEHEPFKKRIGQVILDKAANVETVVNKTGIIETQFRTFPMEVLAGKDDMNVDLKMNGFRFRFNFAKVYWNSRLSEEHERLVKNRFAAGDIVLDGFCGVGPFAVRAVKKGCAVQANDLNPESVASLIENAKLNKVTVKDCRGTEKLSERQPDTLQNGVILAYNTDAREFLRFVLKGLPPLPTKIKAHVVMNLPATAPEFLDSLVGAVPANHVLPNIHCYCFSTAVDTEGRTKDVQDRVRRILGVQPTQELDVEVRDVRDVAPNKYMVCAHFELPAYLAYKQADETESKKMKPTENVE